MLLQYCTVHTTIPKAIEQGYQLKVASASTLVVYGPAAFKLPSNATPHQCSQLKAEFGPPYRSNASPCNAIFEVPEFHTPILSFLLSF
ncbi:hypothetical protein CB0940_07573, partial [Cercospora beticola]